MRNTFDHEGRRVFSDALIQAWLRWKCQASVELYGQMSREALSVTPGTFLQTDFSSSRATALASQLPMYELDAPILAAGDLLPGLRREATFADASADGDSDDGGDSS